MKTTVIQEQDKQIVKEQSDVATMIVNEPTKEAEPPQELAAHVPIPKEATTDTPN